MNTVLIYNNNKQEFKENNRIELLKAVYCEQECKVILVDSPCQRYKLNSIDKAISLFLASVNENAANFKNIYLPILKIDKYEKDLENDYVDLFLDLAVDFIFNLFDLYALGYMSPFAPYMDGQYQKFDAFSHSYSFGFLYDKSVIESILGDMQESILFRDTLMFQLPIAYIFKYVVPAFYYSLAEDLGIGDGVVTQEKLAEGKILDLSKYRIGYH